CFRHRPDGGVERLGVGPGKFLAPPLRNICFSISVKANIVTNHEYKVGDTVEIVMSVIPEMVGLRGQITGFSNGRVMVRISSKNCRQYGHDFLFPRERIKPVATQASATTKVNEEEDF